MAELTIYHHRSLTSRELVEHCLSRIDRFESQVKAWVMVDAVGARAAADACDAAAAKGKRLGLLQGIPIGVKDIFDVAGWPTLAGSQLRAGHVAEKDAPTVARLRSEGAIILGKTVTTQFASFDPPPTRNPWNLARTPGGSSSGSAAAVSLGMCLAALGSQTGGSITRPASYCGVAGCKPTYGLLPLDGIVPLAHHMDHPGPIARNAADLAILMDCLAGRELGGKYKDHTRIGWLKGFFWEAAEPAVREVTAAAVDKLRAGGLVVEECELAADMPQVILQHRRVMAVEAAEYHRPWFPSRRDKYGANIAKLLDEGIACNALDYAQALREQSIFSDAVDQAMSGFTALLTPSTVDPAPDAATTGNPSFNSPWSYCGLPTATLPCGLVDGLPVGLQLIGRSNNEGRLLYDARLCEELVKFSSRPPLLERDEL